VLTVFLLLKAFNASDDDADVAARLDSEGASAIEYVMQCFITTNSGSMSIVWLLLVVTHNAG